MKIFALLLLVSILFSPVFFIFSKITLAQEVGPVISDINVSTSGDSATITWTTDVPTISSFDWGTNPVENDFSVDDAEYVSSHSATISSLLSCTPYYYVIFATATYEFNITTTSSGSFTSAGCPLPSDSSSSSSDSGTTSTPVEEKPKDTTAPGFSLNTNLSRSYIQTPILSGSATDEVGVDAVEYSTNGGGSWIPASVKGKGESETTFSFSLGVLDDGNYIFLVRVKDTAGNISEIKSYTLVIDRLSPQVGTVIFSSGRQVSAPTKEGVLVTVAGLEQKITLSALSKKIVGLTAT